MGKQIGPSFIDELTAYGGLVGQHFTWQPDGTIEFFDDTPAAVVQGVQAVYAAHDPTKPSVSERTAQRDTLMQSAALAMAPLVDAVSLGTATTTETAALTAWREYRVALSRLDLTQSTLTWPPLPDA
jgi:hypothetical protein